MENVDSVRIDDLSQGAELDDEELRAIVGAQKSCFTFDTESCTCHPTLIVDCD